VLLKGELQLHADKRLKTTAAVRVILIISILAFLPAKKVLFFKNLGYFLEIVFKRVAAAFFYSCSCKFCYFTP